METSASVDPAPKKIRNRNVVRQSLAAVLHTSLYFPLTLPEQRVLQSTDRARHQRLIFFALVFWVLIAVAAGLFLGVWFIGYSGAHLSFKDARAAFQVVGLMNDGITIETDKLEYCTQNTASAFSSKYLCYIGGGTEIIYPDPSGGNLFVVTRYTYRDEVRSCPIDAISCMNIGEAYFKILTRSVFQAPLRCG